MLPLLAQVASVVTLVSGQATTIVRNPSLTDTMRVTVELHHATQTAATVTLGAQVHALVTPATFTLEPGATQTLRIRLREPVPPRTTLRLVTCFTPASADQPASGSDTAPVARLILRTCMNTKAVT